MNRALLLSVNAELAEMIFNGKKTVELRRRRPRIERGDYLIIYIPAPFKRIAGVVTVEQVVEARIHTLWRRARTLCAVSYSEFCSYFSGVSVGYGIFLSRPARLASPMPLDLLRKIEPGFTPQGYKYLSRHEISDALERLRPQRTAMESSSDALSRHADAGRPSDKLGNRRAAC